MLGKIAGVLLLSMVPMAAQAASPPDMSSAVDNGARTHAPVAPAPTGGHTSTVMGVSVTVVAPPDVRSPAPAKPTP